jgi:catechol 2,3-dioxygenase
MGITRRGLLNLAGISSLSTAMAGAVRAEGGALRPFVHLAQARDVAPSGELPFANRTPVRCGQAALRVRDLEAMIRYYESAIGLTLIEKSDGRAVMGVPGTPLLHLVSRPNAPVEHQTQAGLFHIAFLMPTRADLARWLVHAAQTRIPLTGFADHSVSEAIYLDDPEGNGLEIYSDRPTGTWQWDGPTVTMGTHQLDIDNLVAAARDERTRYESAPDRLRIGHMHLRVGDIQSGRDFYERALGLASTRGERPSAAFLASGGYHHHIAINIWQSAGAGARSTETTGLDWFSLHVEKADLLAAQTQRLKKGGATVADIDGGIEVADPWGTTLRLVRV